MARLEARAAEGHMERDSLILLAQARAALGVSLGTVLPEERLASAARWTGQAVEIAEHLGDDAFHAHTLRMQGNELRKAGHLATAVEQLQRSLDLSRDPADQGGTLAFLCRALGELGDAQRFDDTLDTYRRLLDIREAAYCSSLSRCARSGCVDSSVLAAPSRQAVTFRTQQAPRPRLNGTSSSVSQRVKC
ncbi:hypothetical protein [Nocardia sp. CNY236]|uniref:hypothetical protein n=1 Tax=Nocardia sp. CNY236 TaxID=1169152 RepID=UPI0018C8FB2C|nr:hypothetical protein [Nocardia sp. CNY236]